MRLTLRTLLAYLDDSLEPSAAKEIGAKVADNPDVQELIERLRKVTRRRGLAAPDVNDEDDASDPNTIAEYLDNVLPPDQLEGLEETALTSDVTLAEIAACHQILTLVLGEPAKVPPLARQRMYRLVRGPESIPYRRATANANVAGLAEPELTEDGPEVDDALLLGLPRISRSSGRIGRLILGATILSLAVTGCILLLLPEPRSLPNNGYLAVAPPTKTEVTKKADTTKKTDAELKKEAKSEPKTVVVTPMNPELPEVKIEPKFGPRITVNPPSPEPGKAATLEDTTGVLLRRPVGTVVWERIRGLGTPISALDPLVTLPGYSSVLKLDSGVQLETWGIVSDQTEAPLPLHEVRLTLAMPSRSLDGDITLESGRIILKNTQKEPRTVRLRVAEEVWDITLPNDQCEVGIDRVNVYPPGVPFSTTPGGEKPVSVVVVVVLKGTASVRADDYLNFADLTVNNGVRWDNKREGAKAFRDSEKGIPWRQTVISTRAEVKRDLEEGLKFLELGLKPKDAPVLVTLTEILKLKVLPFARKQIAMEGLQAVESYSDLIDFLADADPRLRNYAIVSLRHSLGQSPERDLAVFQLLKGLKSFNEQDEALPLMQLLHVPSQAETKNPMFAARLFELMASEKEAVREVAFWWMRRIDPQGEADSGQFNPLGTQAQRDGVIGRWKASYKKRQPK